MRIPISWSGIAWNGVEWSGLVWKGTDDEDEDEAEAEAEADGRLAPNVSSPRRGVILGATSVYKCDKGLFARVFCVLKCVQSVTKCVQGVSA